MLNSEQFCYYIPVVIVQIFTLVFVLGQTHPRFVLITAALSVVRGSCTPATVNLADGQQSTSTASHLLMSHWLSPETQLCHHTHDSRSHSCSAYCRICAVETSFYYYPNATYYSSVWRLMEQLRTWSRVLSHLG